MYSSLSPGSFLDNTAHELSDLVSRVLDGEREMEFTRLWHEQERSREQAAAVLRWIERVSAREKALLLSLCLRAWRAFRFHRQEQFNSLYNMQQSRMRQRRFVAWQRVIQARSQAAAEHAARQMSNEIACRAALRSWTAAHWRLLALRTKAASNGARSALRRSILHWNIHAQSSTRSRYAQQAQERLLKTRAFRALSLLCTRTRLLQRRADAFMRGRASLESLLHKQRCWTTWYQRRQRRVSQRLQTTFVRMQLETEQLRVAVDAAASLRQRAGEVLSEAQADAGRVAIVAEEIATVVRASILAKTTSFMQRITRRQALVGALRALKEYARCTRSMRRRACRARNWCTRRTLASAVRQLRSHHKARREHRYAALSIANKIQQRKLRRSIQSLQQYCCGRQRIRCAVFKLATCNEERRARSFLRAWNQFTRATRTAVHAHHLKTVHTRTAFRAWKLHVLQNLQARSTIGVNQRSRFMRNLLRAWHRAAARSSLRRAQAQRYADFVHRRSIHVGLRRCLSALRVFTIRHRQLRNRVQRSRRNTHLHAMARALQSLRGYAMARALARSREKRVRASAALCRARHAIHILRRKATSMRRLRSHAFIICRRTHRRVVLHALLALRGYAKRRVCLRARAHHVRRRHVRAILSHIRSVFQRRQRRRRTRAVFQRIFSLQTLHSFFRAWAEVTDSLRTQRTSRARERLSAGNQLVRIAVLRLGHHRITRQRARERLRTAVALQRRRAQEQRRYLFGLWCTRSKAAVRARERAKRQLQSAALARLCSHARGEKRLRRSLGAARCEMNRLRVAARISDSLSKYANIQALQYLQRVVFLAWRATTLQAACSKLHLANTRANARDSERLRNMWRERKVAQVLLAWSLFTVQRRNARTIVRRLQLHRMWKTWSCMVSSMRAYRQAAAKAQRRLLSATTAMWRTRLRDQRAEKRALGFRQRIRFRRSIQYWYSFLWRRAHGRKSVLSMMHLRLGMALRQWSGFVRGAKRTRAARRRAGAAARRRFHREQRDAFQKWRTLASLRRKYILCSRKVRRLQTDLHWNCWRWRLSHRLQFRRARNMVLRARLRVVVGAWRSSLRASQLQRLSIRRMREQALFRSLNSWIAYAQEKGVLRKAAFQIMNSRLGAAVRQWKESTRTSVVLKQAEACFHQLRAFRALRLWIMATRAKQQVRKSYINAQKFRTKRVLHQWIARLQACRRASSAARRRSLDALRRGARALRSYAVSRRCLRRMKATHAKQRMHMSTIVSQYRALWMLSRNVAESAIKSARAESRTSMELRSELRTCRQDVQAQEELRARREKDRIHLLTRAIESLMDNEQASFAQRYSNRAPALLRCLFALWRREARERARAQRRADIVFRARCTAQQREVLSILVSKTKLRIALGMRDKNAWLLGRDNAHIPVVGNHAFRQLRLRCISHALVRGSAQRKARIILRTWKDVTTTQKKSTMAFMRVFLMWQKWAASSARGRRRIAATTQKAAQRRLAARMLHRWRVRTHSCKAESAVLSACSSALLRRVLLHWRIAIISAHLQHALQIASSDRQLARSLRMELDRVTGAARAALQREREENAALALQLEEARTEMAFELSSLTLAQQSRVHSGDEAPQRNTW